MSFLNFFRKNKPESEAGFPAAITLTSINIRLGGDVHAMAGRDVPQIFELPIPFRNKIGSGLLPDEIKGPVTTVSQITIDKPFELLEIKPSLPIEVPYQSEKKFILKIKGPEGSYNGPLLIKFDTSSKDNIDVNVSKIWLTGPTRRMELEESAFSMNIKKGQTFRRDIQAYKVLSLGQKVTSITMQAPFEVAATDPKLPFTIDRKDSYVVSLFIKCPAFSYAGDMDIIFK